MDYTKKLQEIHNKYYDEIVDKYGDYIINLKDKDKIYENTKVLPDKEWNKRFPDKQNVRGFCRSENGKIFLKESTFCDHVAIHEYIHRLSRNFCYKWIFPYKWIEGIMVVNKHYAFNRINEVLTEWIASSITGVSEKDNPYHVGFSCIEKWLKQPDIFEQIIQCYFSNNAEEFVSILINYYHGANTQSVINQVDFLVNKLLQQEA